MADKAWKALERAAAALFPDCRRHWSNSGEDLDFEGPGYTGQVKHVQRLSLEALTQLAEAMERRALPHRAGVVVVKVRRGRGKASPMLVVCTAAVWRHLQGGADDVPSTDERTPA